MPDRLAELDRASSLAIGSTSGAGTGKLALPRRNGRRPPTTATRSGAHVLDVVLDEVLLVRGDRTLVAEGLAALVHRVEHGGEAPQLLVGANGVGAALDRGEGAAVSLSVSLETHADTSAGDTEKGMTAVFSK